MKEERKALVRKVAATTAVAGAMALGTIVWSASASAEPLGVSGSGVLINVTPGASQYAPMGNITCCQRSENGSCC
jgi:hypothetical protein